jgi:hypothetical protein
MNDTSVKQPAWGASEWFPKHVETTPVPLFQFPVFFPSIAFRRSSTALSRKLPIACLLRMIP